MKNVRMYCVNSLNSIELIEAMTRGWWGADTAPPEGLS